MGYVYGVWVGGVSLAYWAMGYVGVCMGSVYVWIRQWYVWA